MKIKRKRLLIIISVIAAFIFSAAGIFYIILFAGFNKTADNITEVFNIKLPKSQNFKVTTTAKGDNQSKIASLNGEIYTYYLDNSGCTDPSARGNDKTMRLIRIRENGEYEIFDSVPVWMHGNVLTDEAAGRIYYTTYEEEYEEGTYNCSVKIYTYQLNGGTLTRTKTETLSGDKIMPNEANPRVGADIDGNGNIAIAFGNYEGVMFVHVYDKQNGVWIKHSIEHYKDTYRGDSNMYPYVRLKGINCIKVASSRDTTNKEGGGSYKNPLRDYTRYFSYDGAEWKHFIIADVREKDPEGEKVLRAVPLELYIDENSDTHIFTTEINRLHYYKIDKADNKTEIELFNIKRRITNDLIRLIDLNGKKYIAVSGRALKGFKETGYIEIYDYDTHKLLYRNNSVCKTPYLYTLKTESGGYIDLMLISRDKNYKENCETHFIRLKIA